MEAVLGALGRFYGMKPLLELHPIPDDEKALEGMLSDAKKMGAEHSECLSQRLMEFRKGREVPGFSRNYLARHHNRRVPDEDPLMEEELDKYGLVLDQKSPGLVRGLITSISLGLNINEPFESEYNACLTYEGRVVASMGFDPRKGALFISEIQGLQGNKEVLSKVRWYRAIADFFRDLAVDAGVENIGVISWNNNPWKEEAERPYYGFLRWRVLAGKVIRPNPGVLYHGTAAYLKAKKGPDGNKYLRLERKVVERV